MTQQRDPAAGGDDPAGDFEAFVRANGALLRAVVSRAARGRGDHEDLLQEALTRAYEKRHTFVSARHAVNWIGHVVRCLLVDEQRSWYGRNVVPAAEIPADAGPPSADPADVVALADEGQRAVRAVATLPVAQRQLLWEHAVDGETYADIARRTATPLATVRSAAHRARAAARLAFTGAGNVASGLVAVLRERWTGWMVRAHPTATADGMAACVLALGLLLAGSPAPPGAAAGPPPARYADPPTPAAATPGPRPATTVWRTAPAARPPADPPRRPDPPGAAPSRQVQQVRFSGTYSSACTFTPVSGSPSNRLYEVESYDCHLEARSDQCVSLTTSADLGCVVTVAARLFGEVWRHGYQLGRWSELQCRPQGGSGDQLARSVGVLTYLDAPGSPPIDVPVHITVSHKIVTLSGTVEIDERYFNVSGTLPFSCTDVVDASGFRGEVSYRDRALIEWVPPTDPVQR